MRKLILSILFSLSLATSLFAGQFDGYTVFMSHFNGSDASTAFVDECGNALTAVADAQIDTAQSVFGGASGLFDGTGDYITAVNSAKWNFGNGDFDIDCRVMFHALPVSPAHLGILAHYDSATDNREWLLCLNVVSGVYYLQFNYSTDGTAFTTCRRTWTPTFDTWYHLKAARSGNDLILFIDGVKQGDAFDVTGVTFNTGTYVLTVGRGATTNDVMNGWIDEAKIDKGIARQTADFLIPTTEYVKAGYGIIY